MYKVPQSRKVTDTTFYVTASLEPRRPLLSDARSVNIVLNSLNFFRQKQEINLYGFVVMPDHIHLILKVMAPLTISNFMRRFKDFTAHEIGTGPIWEKGYWSEVITSGKRFYEKLHYIHENPVRANLVAEEADFEWSSARDYLTMSESPRIERLDA